MQFIGTKPTIGHRVGVQLYITIVSTDTRYLTCKRFASTQLPSIIALLLLFLVADFFMPTLGFTDSSRFESLPDHRDRAYGSMTCLHVDNMVRNAPHVIAC